MARWERRGAPYGRLATRSISTKAPTASAVTPMVVRAVAQKDLSRPDDGFASASDPQADLLGSINRIYGAPGRPESTKNYRGTYGFITD